MINWNNLKPYKSDQRKSFEELCYQIACIEHRKSGQFTNLDDSGGGDGVEFYLTLPNGEVWGWQSKFIGRLAEGGRKEQIKKSLKRSLTKHPSLKRWIFCSKLNFTAEEHKWFYDELPGTTINGEKIVQPGQKVQLLHWGESEFHSYLHKNPDIQNYFFNTIDLDWPFFRDKFDEESKTTELSEKYEQKLHLSTSIDEYIAKVLGGFLLADLITNEMDRNQVAMYAEEYKSSLESLHAEEVEDEFKEVQSVLKQLTKDKFDIIQDGINGLKQIIKELKTGAIEDVNTLVSSYKKYLGELRAYYENYNEISNSELCDGLQHIRSQNIEESKQKLHHKHKTKLDKVLEKFKNIFLFKKTKTIASEEAESYTSTNSEIEKENSRRKKARDILFSPLYSLSEYAMTSLEGVFYSLNMIHQQELHVAGEAGMGKTHVAFNIVEKLIQNNRPAIFINAKELSSELGPDRQILQLLGLPADWTLDQFLGALNIAGKVRRTKIPIIIDGLNESRYWNTIWKNNLEKILIKVKDKYNHIVIITTYRTSYEEQLFPNNYFHRRSDRDSHLPRVYAPGFANITDDAIDRYFQFYKIKLENRTSVINEFKHPLYLKLFCETKNPDRKVEVSVSFTQEDLFDVFEEYLSKCNKNICENLNIAEKYNQNYTSEKLARVAKYLWEYSCRGVPKEINIFNDQELSAFEGENLLIYRNWNRQLQTEEIQFTYDFLGGYIISKHLLIYYGKKYPFLKVKIKNRYKAILEDLFSSAIPQIYNGLLRSGIDIIEDKAEKLAPIKRFIRSNEFRLTLLNKDTKHPLFNDILRCFSVLLIKEKNILLFKVLSNKLTEDYALNALFEIQSKYLQPHEEDIKNFIERLHDEKDNRARIYNLLEIVELDPNHILNFNYFSSLLFDMSMPERDLSWSEYIRRHNQFSHKYFSEFTQHFINTCRRDTPPVDKLKLALAAKKIMWLLVSNMRRLRDKATKAIYWYARIEPDAFLELLETSYEINDPYVSERMYAAAYGMAMANHVGSNKEDFIQTKLPKLAKSFFSNIFADNAPHPTSHILARDYAKRTIDLALQYDSDLISKSQKTNIAFPFKNFKHIDWKESGDRNEKEYRDGNSPIGMDFGNYTIGGLVKGRSNYDMRHNEYRKVLGQIYWRIYNLGYSLENYGEIDKQIAGFNWDTHSAKEDGKIDRYGKKYSWIAYYELYGFRTDQGLILDWDGESQYRVPDVDIDPSFPEEIKSFDFNTYVRDVHFLGAPNSNPQNWATSTDDLNVENLLALNLNLDNKNTRDWILLQCDFSQKDEENPKRDVRIVIQSALVDYDDELKLKETIGRHEHISFGLYRPPSHYYLFEGEIPWCELMPDNEIETFLISYLNGANGKETIEINLEPTFFVNSWEGYHSDIIPPGGTTAPTKEICNEFDLCIHPQSSDLYKGKELASTAFNYSPNEYFKSDFTYFRTDLMREYVAKHNKKLIWLQWSEKRYFKDGLRSFNHKDDENIFNDHHRIIFQS